jgi:hypothetical protein
MLPPTTPQPSVVRCCMVRTRDSVALGEIDAVAIDNDRHERSFKSLS